LELAVQDRANAWCAPSWCGVAVARDGKKARMMRAFSTAIGRLEAAYAVASSLVLYTTASPLVILGAMASTAT
jgi:hypothetical protein